MIEKPPSPHDLVGEHWPEIDELGIASFAAALINMGTASTTAEQKTFHDATAYQSSCPEGFESQVDAAFKVGGMASDLSSWFAKTGAEAVLTAESVAMAKVQIVVTTLIAEAIIAAKEAEIAALQAASLRPEVREQRIQQLRSEIRQVTDEAKQAIGESYNGIYAPSVPSAPELQSLVHHGPPPESGGAIPATPVDFTTPGQGERGGSSAGPVPATQGEKRDAAPPRPVDRPPGRPDATWGQRDGSSPTPTRAPLAEKPGAGPIVSPPQVPSDLPPVSAPAGIEAPGVPSMGGSMVPQMGGVSGLSASPTSSVGSLGSSGLSGMGPSARPAMPTSMTPTQDFLSGVSQGFASQSPAVASGASSAAAAQPFTPPPTSTMQSAPIAPAAPRPVAVAASHQAPLAVASTANPVPVGGMQLAPPPPAGVPNAPATGLPAAAGLGAATGGGGAPVSPSVAPPNMAGLGAKSAAVRAARRGSHAMGETLRATPEFQAALALVAALHDPTIGMLCEWACAVFPQPDGPRFVLASREGLSWTPPGVYLPDGVVLAALDDAVPWEVRKLWRGIRPPALVLAHYAKTIGAQPQAVVARHWSGLDGLFSKRTVIAADDHPTIMDPNPVKNPAGRHRLEVASPDGWWSLVQAVPEADIGARIRGLAAHVAALHDQQYVVVDVGTGQDGADTLLRSNAVSQIGRPGGEAVWTAVEQQMHMVRGHIMTALVTVPVPLVAGWNDDLTDAERMLRGWEVLWLARRRATRETLADMTYAAIAAADETWIAAIAQILRGVPSA